MAQPCRGVQRKACSRCWPAYVCTAVTICNGKNWEAYFASLQGGLEALQMIIRNEHEKEPWDEMFSNEKQRRDLV